MYMQSSFDMLCRVSVHGLSLRQPKLPHHTAAARDRDLFQNVLFPSITDKLKSVCSRMTRTDVLLKATFHLYTICHQYFALATTGTEPGTLQIETLILTSWPLL